MKREGRQHGVVRSYAILPSELSQRRFVKTVDSSAASGLFTKVSRKPTNQSKFTGKCCRARCVGCHIHPACKSKDKAKGTMKLRSIDAKPGWINYPVGTSASGVLAYLKANDGGYDDDDDDDYQGNLDDGNYNYNYNYGDDYDYNYDNDGSPEVELEIGIGIGIAAVITEEHNGNHHHVDVDDDGIDVDDDDDDRMSFCDVGLYWGHGDGDEYADDGWYLVGQMQ